MRIAAITALLFAVHPMHVESVAWVSERKDVLYAFFYLLALCTYVKYAEAPKVKLYVTVFVFFLLSLLSKGMAVTLPLVLLAIDYYRGKKPFAKAILEKTPFLILSVVFGIVAIYAQHSTQAIEVSTTGSYFDRILFGCYAMLTYLWKSIFPFSLSCFYDYPIKHNGYYPAVFYLAPLIIVALAYLVYKPARKNKDIVFALLFFVFTIVVVLQLIPVGKAIVADRYTYIPYIGLFFLLGKWIVSMVDSKSNNRIVLPAFAVIVLVFGWFTYQQCKVWKDSLTLWSGAIKNAPSAVAYCNRGQYYMDANNNDDALNDFTRSIELRDYAAAYLNRSSVYLKTGLIDKALDDCNKMISLWPDNAFAYNTQSECLTQKKDYTASVESADKAIQLKPDYDIAYYTKGNALSFLEKYDEAIDAYNKAIALNPQLKEAYNNRSAMYYVKKEYTLALADAQKAQELGFAVNANYMETLKNSVQ